MAFLRALDGSALRRPSVWCISAFAYFRFLCGYSADGRVQRGSAAYLVPLSAAEHRVELHAVHDIDRLMPTFSEDPTIWVKYVHRARSVQLAFDTVTAGGVWQQSIGRR